MSFLKHSIAIKKIPKTAIATETPNHIRFDPVICVKSLHGGVVYPLNFISKFVSKIIANLLCTPAKNVLAATYIYSSGKSANPHKYKKNPQPQWLRVFFLFGGAEGSRTPVRKRFNRTFSGRSQVSTFPPRKDTGQTLRFSRVMMRGRGNSYPPHGRHLNDAFPGRWPLRFRRSLLKQRRQQC